MLRRILPHVCIVLSLTVLVLLILNLFNPFMGFLSLFNPFMGFLSSAVSLWFLLALCLTALATAIVLVWTDRRQ